MNFEPLTLIKPWQRHLLHKWSKISGMNRAILGALLAMAITMTLTILSVIIGADKDSIFGYVYPTIAVVFVIMISLYQLLVREPRQRFQEFLKLNDLTGTDQEFYCTLGSHLCTFKYGDSGGNFNKGSVFTISLDRALPEIVLDNKRNDKRMSSMGRWYDRRQLLQLEGNFNSTFDVYTPVGNEVAALQILTPDVMLKVLNAHDVFDIFIRDRKLQLVTPGFLGYDAQAMQDMFTIATSLLDKIDRWARVYRNSDECHLQLVGDETDNTMRIGNWRLSFNKLLFWIVGALGAIVTAIGLFVMSTSTWPERISGMLIFVAIVCCVVICYRQLRKL